MPDVIEQYWKKKMILFVDFEKGFWMEYLLEVLDAVNFVPGLRKLDPYIYQISCLWLIFSDVRFPAVSGAGLN